MADLFIHLPAVPAVVLAATLTVPLLVLYLLRYHAKPNEWCLIIRNGHLVRAEVGIQGFRWPFDDIVKFPSRIHKVTFAADQVTQETQGIHVSGFLVWTIFREDDGPFKAYKSLEGLSSDSCDVANEHLARMAESIVRHQIANMAIHEVLSQRHKMRDSMRKEMLEVVKGWGVWIETVEITDVRISSQSLFEAMQTRFRQEAHEASEKIKEATRQRITEQKVEIDTQLAKQREDSKSQQAVYKSQQQLRTEEEESKLLEAQQRIKKARIEDERALLVLKLRSDAEVDQQRAILAEESRRAEIQREMERLQLRQKQLEEASRFELASLRQQLAMEALRKEQELKFLDARLRTEKDHMQLRVLETVASMYKDVDSVKMVSVGHGETPEGLLARMLPFVQQVSRELQHEESSA